ncbi:MAG: flagellar protein FlaG [Spirochaetaceae bacterium]|jgi:flagellar protein FlaG|nr:flagellar protein FlaG [Spirochaetaceae bacterium]
MNTVTNVADTGLPGQFNQTAKRKQNVEANAPVSGDAETSQNHAASRSNKDMEIELSKLEKISRAFNKKLQFVINYESAEITVNVIDTDTDKVIKVLPPEELQRLNRKIEEAIGFLFDEKV